MAVLAVIQEAAKLLGVEIPGSVFGSSDETAQELGAVANLALEEINLSHDWRKLKTRYQRVIEDLSGVGSGGLASLPLPGDYLRMTTAGEIWSTKFDRPMERVISENDWQNHLIRDFTPVTGTWALFSDEIEFLPVLSSETISFYYIRDAAVLASDGAEKPLFTSDTDEYRLSEHLLKLAILWKYKSAKALGFDREVKDYDKTIMRLIAADGGARVIRQRPRHNMGARIAYPTSVSPG